jgi:hypothetical protein
VVVVWTVLLGFVDSCIVGSDIWNDRSTWDAIVMGDTGFCLLLPGVTTALMKTGRWGYVYGGPSIILVSKLVSRVVLDFGLTVLCSVDDCNIWVVGSFVDALGLSTVDWAMIAWGA